MRFYFCFYVTDCSFECYERYYPVLDDVHIDNKTSSTKIQGFVYFQLAFKVRRLLNMAKSGHFTLFFKEKSLHCIYDTFPEPYESVH